MTVLVTHQPAATMNPRADAGAPLKTVYIPCPLIEDYKANLRDELQHDGVTRGQLGAFDLHVQALLLDRQNTPCRVVPHDEFTLFDDSTLYNVLTFTLNGEDVWMMKVSYSVFEASSTERGRQTTFHAPQTGVAKGVLCLVERYIRLSSAEHHSLVDKDLTAVMGQFLRSCQPLHEAGWHVGFKCLPAAADEGCSIQRIAHYAVVGTFFDWQAVSFPEGAAKSMFGQEKYYPLRLDRPATAAALGLRSARS